jgi:hypothetical protein
MKLPSSFLIPLSLFGLLACSDPPPQEAAIGMHLVLQNPQPEFNPEGRTCKVKPNGARSYQIGQPDGAHTVENGKNNVKVSCTVRENPTVQLTVEAQNQAVGLPGVFSYTLDAQVVSLTDATQNTGTLAFFDADAGNMATPTTPKCTLGPPNGQSQITKEPGALFTSLNCPLITAADSLGDGCRVTGTIAIEYCRTGEEETD